jgi:hypothetical protein
MTLAYKEIRPFSGIDLGSTPGAELTGTSTANLYGFFATTPWVVAQIDKTTAQVTGQISLAGLPTRNVGGFAFASWGQDFWFFVDVGGSTDIYHYDAATAQTSLALSVVGGIDGAGVSPCVQAE